MVARILLALIALEAALGAAAGAWLLPVRWTRVWVLVICGLVGVAFLRALMVAISFVYSRRNSTPRASEYRLGVLAGLALYLRESAAQILAFAVLQPLSGWFTPRDDGPGRGDTPVLLVQGLWCNAAIWWKFAQWLRAAGVGPIYTVTLEPPLADIDRLAEQLAAKIDAVAPAATTRIALVAHSMGGLVARAYLRRHGAARVSKLITLGSPHQGSALAGLSFGRCVQQMRPGNLWLTELARTEAGAARLSAVSFYTVHDNLVAPQASGVLANATNVPLSGIGHVELLFRRDVRARVLAEICLPTQREDHSKSARAA